MASYLTFDIGTTALKTALIGDDGRVRAIHTSEYTANAPRPGWAEMDPEAYWRAAVEGTRAVVAQSGAAPVDIAGIGFSSQGETFVALDRAGHPLYPAIVWLDDRARDIVERWQAEWLSQEAFRRSSGYPWLACELTVFKLAWLAENAPAAHRAWKFLFLPDYITYRLTGEVVTDYVIALFSGMLDLQTGNWHPGLMAAARVTAEQLPAIVAPAIVTGRVTAEAARELGIPAGVPVCAGANDQIAGAVGAGNVRPGMITETTGTALAVVATTATLLDDASFCVGRHAVPGAYYALSFAFTSAIVLKWFRDLCGAGETYDEFLRGVESVPPGCDGLTVLPHFSGIGLPRLNPHARGAFVGLTLGHTRAHLARAIMESCACLLQEYLEPLMRHIPAISVVRSLGGAARSDRWLQMKSDMLGLPVERPACSDAASLGAAMLAAAGVGQFASVAEASEAWYRAADTFEPDAQRHAIYSEVYSRYRELSERLYPSG
jgi:xylulokinase